MKTKLLALTASIALLPLPGIAADKGFIQIHGVSYHTFRNGQNERNPGLGYRVVKDSGMTWSVGGYYNSYRRNSFYGTVGKSWSRGVFEYGIEYGLVTGYTDEAVKFAPLPVFGIGPVKTRIILKSKPVFTLSVEVPIH